MTNTIRTTPLTEKEKNKLFTRYMLFGAVGVDPVYLQGKSWPWWLMPFYRKYYKGKELSENLLRHFTWYNTEPILGSIIFGIVLGMEERKAIHQDISGETITAIKSSLMGPVAGIGDSLIQGTLIPILITLVIAISGKSGSILGPVLYIIILLSIILTLAYGLFKQGFKLGKDAIDYFGKVGINKITNSIAVFGLIIVGTLASSMVKIPLKISYYNGNKKVLLSDTLNGIFPNIIALLVILLFYWLLKKKNLKMQSLFYIVMVVTIVISLVGII
ncbi:PTS system mannose/fructose/sorbose family transporter subunit IID [Lactobacillus kimbladii]|uniref:PTS system mannose/fructose/sorbose family transporter subunit IID n=1 Tax=Lactobacillus kimbladii TaxID=1218506 RepID=UPI001650D2F8|nr:PTS system mannose/fructose/sorbose family transporter subunit IID [Lactobacillus kimbladii]MBC6341434.1 PTS system mannose/fructose/sorbose family transporter subunit IID [Lactobacillus kimbladii]